MSYARHFTSFPARFYLERYYSHVGAENGAFMRATASVADSVDELGTVVELGGGPSLCGMLAMTAATRCGPERVVWLDVGTPNLDEIAAWVGGAESAFAYADVLRWIGSEFSVNPLEIVERLRAATWDIRCVDLWEKVPTDLRRVGDVVASYFFAEAATDNESGFVELTARIPEAARAGAQIALAYIRRSEPYRLDNATLYPATAVDEYSLPRLLQAAGLSFAEVDIRRGPVDDPPARPGYDGMVFVSGQLALPD